MSKFSEVKSVMSSIECTNKSAKTDGKNSGKKGPSKGAGGMKFKSPKGGK